MIGSKMTSLLWPIWLKLSPKEIYISRLNQHHHGWKDTSWKAAVDHRLVKIALSEVLNWLLLSSKWLVAIPVLDCQTVKNIYIGRKNQLLTGVNLSQFMKLKQG